MANNRIDIWSSAVDSRNRVSYLICNVQDVTVYLIDVWHYSAFESRRSTEELMKHTGGHTLWSGGTIIVGVNASVCYSESAREDYTCKMTSLVA